MISFYVGLGGGLGALARFGLGGLVTAWAGAGFPWGTYAANVIGSTLLGVLTRGLPRLGVSANSRALLTIGLCGGFTTFSTFDYETLAFLQRHQYVLAGTYSAASVVSCIGGLVAGGWLAARWERRQRRRP